MIEVNLYPTRTLTGMKVFFFSLLSYGGKNKQCDSAENVENGTVSCTAEMGSGIVRCVHNRILL